MPPAALGTSAVAGSPRITSWKRAVDQCAKRSGRCVIARSSSATGTGVDAAPCSRRKLSVAAVAAALLAGYPVPAQASASPAPLDIDEVASTIKRDFQAGQYYVTGRLTPAIYDDNCLFKDPTVTVSGVKKYSEAVANLFDAATSRADLISIEVQDRRTVRLRWRLEGTLKLGNLRIKPYTGTTVYSTNEQGRVVRHVETWDISPLDVFVSLVNPNFGVPPAPPV